VLGRAGYKGKSSKRSVRFFQGSYRSRRYKIGPLRISPRVMHLSQAEVRQKVSLVVQNFVRAAGFFASTAEADGPQSLGEACDISQSGHLWRDEYGVAACGSVADAEKAFCGNPDPSRVVLPPSSGFGGGVTIPGYNTPFVPPPWEIINGQPRFNQFPRFPVVEF